MFFGRLDLPGNVTFAGGQASNADLFSAAYDSLQYVDNANAAETALMRAYEDRIATIHEATGVQLANPMREAAQSLRQSPPISGAQLWSGQGEDYQARTRRIYDGAQQNFARQLSDIAQQYPAQARLIGAERPVSQDALTIARNADKRFETLFQSRNDLWKWGIAFAGGGLASLNDPFTVGALMAGGGPGAAKTIGGRILSTALSEALVNGATEAILQPQVQNWRAQAGLPSGFDEAMKNVGFATAFGGALGAGGRAVHEAFATMGAKLQPNVAAGLAGDAQAAAEALQPIREALPAEARGALDAIEGQKLSDSLKPANIAPDQHNELVANFENSVRDAKPVEWQPDERQITRIADELAPTPPDEFQPRVLGENFDTLLSDMRQTTRRPRGLTEKPALNFLKKHGIKPDSPMAAEFRHATGNQRFPGIIRKNAASLDNIPLDEAIQDFPGLAGRPGIDDGNGYLNREALLSALRDELEGKPWLTTDQASQLERFNALSDTMSYLKEQGVDFRAKTADIKMQLEKVAQAERAIVDLGADFKVPHNFSVPDFTPPSQAARMFAGDIVRELTRRAGPGVDDQVIHDAALDVIYNHSRPQDALDKALGREQLQPLPAEASAFPDRPPEPSGFDNPGAPDAGFDLTDADLAEFSESDILPTATGPMTLAEMRAELNRADTLTTLVEACKP